MDSPSGRRFARRSGEASSSSLTPDPIKRIPRLPSSQNASPVQNGSSNGTMNGSAAILATSPSSAMDSPRSSNRFVRKPTALALDPPPAPRDVSRRNLTTLPEKESLPARTREASRRNLTQASPQLVNEPSTSQIVQEWDLPRKRGQTPVSEAKFYSQLEKVSAFMRMLIEKEKEDQQKAANSAYSHPEKEQQGPAILDLLTPDFEGTRNIAVRPDLLSPASSSSFPISIPLAEGADASSVSSPPRGRFGREPSSVISNSTNTYSPITDNRKLRSNTIDVKYHEVE